MIVSWMILALMIVSTTVVDLTLVVKKRSLWLKGVKLYLDCNIEFHYETMYYPLCFSFSFMSGPSIDGEAWFDSYIVYLNNVALSCRRLNFLENQVALLKPEIPF
jgi:hypothetical protein